MEVEVKIPGVKVDGTLKLDNLYGALAAILSRKCGVDITFMVEDPEFVGTDARKKNGSPRR